MKRLKVTKSVPKTQALKRAREAARDEYIRHSKKLRKMALESLVLKKKAKA
jgi:hypothetical protein